MGGGGGGVGGGCILRKQKVYFKVIHFFFARVKSSHSWRNTCMFFYMQNKITLHVEEPLAFTKANEMFLN